MKEKSARVAPTPQPLQPKPSRSRGRPSIGIRTSLHLSEQDVGLAQALAPNGKKALGVRLALHACAMLGVEVVQMLAQRYGEKYLEQPLSAHDFESEEERDQD